MSSNKKHLNHESNESNWISWIFLIVTLASAYYISMEESYSKLFLIFLLFNIGFAVFFSRKINKTVLNISRVLLGLLFVYSGFVKGVDPLGTQFKIEDYFYAYNMAWAKPMALALSVLLNAAEFSMGALLILRVKTKWVSLFSLLMMLMFTITTLYDALYSPVPDCGCFGDALVITNWQTFYKNLVINAFILIVFLRRFDFSSYKSIVTEIISLFVVVFGFMFFEYYSIKNLPPVDFRTWKVGNRLIPENPKPVKYYLTYKNIETAEEKEYLSKELPWQDSIFMAEWEWASSREDDPNIADMNLFPIVDASGSDISKELVSDENYVFIFVIYNLQKVPLEMVDPMNQMYADASDAGHTVVMLNSDLPDDYMKFKEENGLADFPLYNSDDTALKAAIRSNPGLIIVRSGEVISKYHYNNFPTYKEFLSER